MGNKTSSEQSSNLPSMMKELSLSDTTCQQRQYFQTFEKKRNIDKIGLKPKTVASKNLFKASNYSKMIEVSAKQLIIPQSMPLPSLSILEEEDQVLPSNTKQLLDQKIASAFEQNEATVDDIIEVLQDESSFQVRQENVFDFYSLKKYIGKDDHKSTYLVESIETQQLRCLRIIPKVFFHHNELIEGENEINNLIKIKHKYVVQLFEAFEDINSYYLVFQYIRGQNIQEYIASQTFSWLVCNTIAKKILMALQYIHSKGVVHRDLRLQNVIIYHKNGQVDIKIINFGLSIDLNESKSDKYSYGSLFYAPPESYEGIINQKYDIWSTGIMILVMFTCKSSQIPATKFNLFQMTKKRAQLKEHIKLIPQKVKEFVMQILITKNKRRPSAQKALKLEWISGEASSKRRFKSQNLDNQILYKL